MLRIAVFVSGRGSNLLAILNAIPNSLQNVEISAILSNKADCPALKLADLNSIPTYIVSYKQKENYITFDKVPFLLDALNL